MRRRLLTRQAIRTRTRPFRIIALLRHLASPRPAHFASTNISQTDAAGRAERPYVFGETQGHFRPSELFCACFAFAAAALVYVYSLAPTITFGDSGELITAARVLGVAHPPGYPLWLLIGKLFSLLPIRSIAYRLNLMSAFFNAAAIGLLTLVLARTLPQMIAPITPRESGDSPVAKLLIGSASATAALSLGFSTTFWQQSVSAEVYALNNFIICLILLLIILWGASPQKNNLLFVTALVCGAGMGNHQTLALMLPAVALYVLLVRPRVITSPGALIGCLAFFVLGLSLYLYLPIRASANPPLNWGDPSTWDAFRSHVLRKQYRSLELVRPPGVVAGQVKFFLGSTLKESFPLSLLVPALLAAPFANKEGRKWLAFTIAAFICTGILLVVIANTELDLNAQDLLRIYFLPAWIFATMGIGYGIGAINALALRASEGLRRRALPALLLAAVWLLVPISGMLANYQSASLRGHPFGRKYGEALLNGLPVGSILFAGTDSAYAIPMYMKWVQGRRPDITILSVNRLSDTTYHAEAERNTAGLPFLTETDYAEAFSMYSPPRADGGVYGSHNVGRLNAFLLLKLYRNLGPERPVYYDQGLPIEWIPDCAVPSGLLVELTEKREALMPEIIASDSRYWRRLEESLFSDQHFLHDSAARQKFSKCRSNIGYLYLRRNMYPEATEALEQAIRFSDRNIEAYSFLALAYKEQGEREKAIAVFDDYLRRDTWNTSARAFAESLAR